MLGQQEVRIALIRMLGASLEQEWHLHWTTETRCQEDGMSNEICLLEQSQVPIASHKPNEQNLRQETRGILFGVNRSSLR